MDIVNAFPTHWLDTRFSFDADARDVALEQSVLGSFPSLDHLHIVDVGAGNGANYKYFSDKLPQADWTLIEHDPVLVEACKQQFPQAPIQYRALDLMQLAQEINLQSVDLLTANAVFDLFSAQQFLDFAKQLAEAKVPLYLTLNYKAMGFVPELPDDDTFIAAYNAHMERPQAFGRAMGSQGPEKIAHILENLGYTVERAPSWWLIWGESEVMLQYMLHFMESAIPELEGFNLKEKLNEWLADKRQLVSAGALSIWVEHEDLWARFP